MTRRGENLFYILSYLISKEESMGDILCSSPSNDEEEFDFINIWSKSNCHV